MPTLLQVIKHRKVVALIGIAAVLAVGGVYVIASGASSGAINIPGAAGLPPAKANLLQQEIQQANQEATKQSTQSEAQGAASAAQKAVPGTSLPFPTGIQSTKQAPFSSSQFEVSNQWHTIFNGQEYLIFFGSLGTPSGSQGEAAVEVWKNEISGASVQSVEVGLYKYAPAGNANLTGTGTSGSVANLAYADGTVDFNLASDSFDSAG